jgi:hypothetical protein
MVVHPFSKLVSHGRIIAQAVWRRLPTAAARVRAPARSCGICGGQSGAGAGFLCQFSFHLLLHIHHHLSSGADTIHQLVADVPIGLSLTPPQATKKKQKQLVCLLYNLLHDTPWVMQPSDHALPKEFRV